MKKETTFLKLFTLLALSCLSIGYAWADSHEIHFDRANSGDDVNPNNEIPFSKTPYGTYTYKVGLVTMTKNYTEAPLNCTSSPVPNGSDWIPSGSTIKAMSGTQEHYYGYNLPYEYFQIDFTNFKYVVTKILFSIDAGDGGTTSGRLSFMPYNGTQSEDSVIEQVAVTDQGKVIIDFNIVSQNITWNENIAGIQSLRYTHLNSIPIFFNKSNFLQLTYQDPVISKSSTSSLPTLLGPGCTYTLKDADVSWDNYQGAFTIDDVLFTNSSNTGAITISNDGKSITGVAAGTSTITVQVVNSATATDKNAIASSYFTFEVEVADPTITKADNKVTASGCWTSDNLNSSLTSNVDASTTCVDLTGSTIYGAPVTVPTTNKNVLIKASSTDQVTNDHNVIVNGVCNKLKIQDGDIFNNTEAFTATTAEYIREKTDTWNAVCLPYAPVPTEYTTYYKLASAGDNSLTFEKVEEPAANTPYLAKNTTGGNFDATRSTSVSIGITPTTSELNTINANGYVMRGAFNPTSVADGTKYTDAKSGFDLITDANAYYFLDNKFHIINGRFNMLGFRAYLTKVATGEAKTSTLSLNFLDADDYSTDLKFIENEKEGTVKVIFDANGRRQNAPQKGINIINGKKVLIK